MSSPIKDYVTEHKVKQALRKACLANFRLPEVGEIITVDGEEYRVKSVIPSSANVTIEKVEKKS